MAIGISSRGRTRSRSASPAPAIPKPQSAPPARPVPVSPIDKLLSAYLRPEPGPATLYQIKSTDSPRALASSVLEATGVPFGAAQVVDYVHMLCGPYNLRVYGSGLTTRRDSADLLCPGLAQGVIAAFRPRNADALPLIRAGKFPPCTVDRKTGAALTDADSYGLLWCPPICPYELADGNVTGEPFAWPDGSSTIDPDPALLAMLEPMQ